MNKTKVKLNLVTAKNDLVEILERLKTTKVIDMLTHEMTETEKQTMTEYQNRLKEISRDVTEYEKRVKELSILLEVARQMEEQGYMTGGVISTVEELLNREERRFDLICNPYTNVVPPYHTQEAVDRRVAFLDEYIENKRKILVDCLKSK